MANTDVSLGKAAKKPMEAEPFLSKKLISKNPGDTLQPTWFQEKP